MITPIWLKSKIEIEKAISDSTPMNKIEMEEIQKEYTKNHMYPVRIMPAQDFVANIIWKDIRKNIPDNYQEFIDLPALLYQMVSGWSIAIAKMGENCYVVWEEVPKRPLLIHISKKTKDQYAAPWRFDQEYGQIRDKDGNALASVSISLGDGQDLRNGELMSKAPVMLQILETVNRLIKTPDQVSDEEIKGIESDLKEMGLK